MNSNWIVMATVPLLFAPAIPASPAWNGGSNSQPGSKLVRVQPNANEDEAFDRDAWRKKLTQADLDGRERAFDKLVDLARRKDPARQALEAWSKDESQPDLAWTSRLALRSLNSSSAGDGGTAGSSPHWNDLHSRLDQLRQRFDNLDPMIENMQQDLDRLFQQPMPFQQWNVPPGHPGSSSEAQSFSLQVGPDGVTCEVTENVNGDKQTHKYTAGSMEELLEAHPELRDRIGTGGGGQSFSFGAPRSAPFAAPRQRSNDNSKRGNASAPRTDVLGIECVKPEAEKIKDLGLEPELGLLVERTAPGTIAEILGIQRGDIVIELNGTSVYETSDVGRMLKKREPDGELAVTIIDKKGQRRTLTWRPSTGD